MEESGRMKDLCYTLMDLSELRKEEIAYEEIKTKEFLDQIERIVDFRQSCIYENEPVTVIYQNQLKAGQNFYGNRCLLEILMLNLVLNAIRACRQKRKETEDEVSVIVILGCGRVPGEQIEIRVRDNGIGIPKEKLDRLTEPFYRVDAGRSREDGGNGLGLALCRQIAECHHGTISFSSIEGEGTLATVRIKNERRRMQQ